MDSGSEASSARFGLARTIRQLSVQYVGTSPQLRSRIVQRLDVPENVRLVLHSLRPCWLPAFNILVSKTVAYYSSSLPLPLLFDDFSFRRGLLTREFREHNDHALDRPKQGIPGEHDK